MYPYNSRKYAMGDFYIQSISPIRKKSKLKSNQEKAERYMRVQFQNMFNKDDLINLI